MAHRRTRLSRHIITVAGAAVLVLALTGEAPPVTQPVTHSSIDAAWAGTIHSSGEPEAVQAAVDSLDSAIFVDAHLGRSPHPDDRPGDWWFYATLKVPSDRPEDRMYAMWLAALAQGVIEERTATTGKLAEAVGGSTFVGQLPDGTTVDLGGGSGDVASGQRFDDSPASAVTQRITDTLAGFGAQPQTIRVLRPLNNAIFVVMRVPNLVAVPGGYNAIRNELAGNITAESATYEGYYLEIQDAAGTPITIGTASFRTGIGSTWVKDGYDGKIGAVHG